MWTAQILNTTCNPSFFSARVVYTNGDRTFTEDIDMTGGDVETFHRRVDARLKTLEATDALNVAFPPTGPFVPVVPPPSDEEKLRAAVTKIKTIKEYEDLGIISTFVPVQSAPVTATVDVVEATPTPTPVSATDVLTQAITDAQGLFDPTKL